MDKLELNLQRKYAGSLGTQNSVSLHLSLCIWFPLLCSLSNNAEPTLCVALLGRNTADNNSINSRGQDTAVTLLDSKVCTESNETFLIEYRKQRI